MNSTAYYKTILRTRVLHLSTHSHPSVQHTPWEMDGGCSLWSLCETCWGSHSTRLYNGRMPDVTFDVNVIWANWILEAFGECCCEVLVLFWLWAGSAGRALGWEAAVVLNGLSRACETCGSSFVLRLFWCICPLCFLLSLFKNSALFHFFQYNEASTGTDTGSPVSPAVTNL